MLRNRFLVVFNGRTVARNPITLNNSGLILFDNFDRADGAPGSNYTIIQGNFLIASNVLRLASTADGDRMKVADSVFGAARSEMVVQCKMRRVGSERRSFPGLLARWVDNTSAYFWELTNATSEQKDDFVRRISSANTVLNSSSEYTGHDIWYQFKLHVKNSFEKGWKDGILQVDKTDNALDAIPGTAGFRGGWFTATTDAHEWNDYSCYKSNSIVCSGLPTGFKLKAGSLSATESSGTATIDLVETLCPLAKVQVTDGSDVVVAELIPPNLVWGGDVYSYAA